LNLAYRWFCRLDLSDDIPDHSTFSKNRHGRFRESDLLRHVFETTVARCMEEGLVGACSRLPDHPPMTNFPNTFSMSRLVCQLGTT
jgi:hypothetical protein